MGVEQRVTTEPSIVRQAASLLSEGGEIPPYAPTFVPPYPFPSLGNAGTTAGGGDDTFEQVPGPYDLVVLRSDAITTQFFFAGVCWTTTQPVGTLPAGMVWEQHWWNAQIRNPNVWAAYGDPCWWYNRWIPVFGIYPDYDDWFAATLVAEFSVETKFLPSFGGEAGTQVTIHLDSDEMVHVPGTGYRWDLQSATEMVITTSAPPVLDHYEGVRTWLQGAVTIKADVTAKPTKVSI